MGYSEVPCKFCGVSFNVGRLRKADEPTTAAWNGNADDGRPISFVNNGYPGRSDECGPNTGCSLFERKAEDENIRGLTDGQRQKAEQKKWEEELQTCVDDKDDETYQSTIESSDERYEYDSTDVNDDDKESDVEMKDDDDDKESDVEMKDDDDDEAWEAASQLYQEWKNGINPDTNEQLQESGSFRRWKAPVDFTVGTPQGSSEGENLEHIAGPDCGNCGGYNPFAISAEEMRGCKTIQCLAIKDRHWRPEPDDEDFEVSSKYFLTGICNHMPSRDCGSPDVFPTRHSLETPYADVCDFDIGEDMAMPFHPTCFEIFKHLSRRRFGKIDINGLMDWWNIESSYEHAYGFPRHEDVNTASEQWWVHHRGAEYLAANPVFIPGLDDLLLPAISTNPSFSAKDGAFSANLDQVKVITNSTNDPFSRLPQELKFYILNHLSSLDIAHLRLTSRAFYQLPISLWHRLLVDEMPWLWEVDDFSPSPSFWTRVTVPQLKARQAAKDAYEAQLKQYRDVIGQEMPELKGAWERAEPRFEDVVDVADVVDPFAGSPEMAKLPVRLPRDRTNWYLVYRNLAVHGTQMKGLRNRRRIWTDVEEIVARIAGYREEGRIV